MDVQIFEPMEQAKYLDIFRNSNLYDLISTKEGLSDELKVAIYQLVQKGSISNFLYFLDKATNMAEDEIKEAIILFHKVQKGADDSFTIKSNSFIQSLETQDLTIE